MNGDVPVYLVVLGQVAGAGATVGMVAQLVHTIRLRRANQLSALALSGTTLSGVGLLVYAVILASLQGGLIGLLPLIIPNAIVGTCAIWLLVLKRRYRGRETADPAPAVDAPSV